MANFISSLTGTQLNDALTQVNQRVPEGWAVGEKDGIPVSSSSPYYHNNAKYYAENALDSANRAEAAVPAGTAGAVFFDRVQTLTDAQAMQARANIVAGGSNPNLIDNPFFEVNQRSFSSTATSATYTVDRWRATAVPTGGVVSLSNGIMTIDATALTANYCSLEQRFPFNLAGKTVTLSCMASDGTIYQGTAVVPAQSTSQQIAINISLSAGSLRLYVSTNNNYPCFVQFRIGYGNSFSVKAVKLEIGSVSTLANDTAPNYAEELAKCQRYFQRVVSNQSVAIMGYGAAYGGTAARITLPLPVKMRANPSISTVGAIGSFALAGNGQNLAVASVAIPTQTESNLIGINVTISGGTLSYNQAYLLIASVSNIGFDLSADL